MTCPGFNFKFPKGSKELQNRVSESMPTPTMQGKMQCRMDQIDNEKSRSISRTDTVLWTRQASPMDSKTWTALQSRHLQEARENPVALRKRAKSDLVQRMATNQENGETKSTVAQRTGTNTGRKIKGGEAEGNRGGRLLQGRIACPCPRPGLGVIKKD